MDYHMKWVREASVFLHALTDTRFNLAWHRVYGNKPEFVVSEVREVSSPVDSILDPSGHYYQVSVRRGNGLQQIFTLTKYCNEATTVLYVCSSFASMGLVGAVRTFAESVDTKFDLRMPAR